VLARKVFDQVAMADADSDLQRLEQTVRLARERLAQLIRKDTDPAAIEVATETCIEIIAAVRSFLAHGK
jgi:hypothetical protein